MALRTCPICRRSFDESEPAAALPFCSQRCKLVDLGRWLGESYGVPAPPREEAFDPDEEEPV